SKTHLCRLSLSFNSNHVSPDSIPLPNNMLSQVKTKLTFGSVQVAASNDIRIKAFNLSNLRIDLLNCRFRKCMGAVNLFFDVDRSKVCLECLVKLLESLRKTRLVELRVTLEFSERNKHLDDSLL